MDFKISNKEDASAAKGEPLGANKYNTVGMQMEFF